MNQAIPHTLGTLLDDMLRKEQADGEEEDFDVLRERLQALGSTAMPGLLEAAQQEDYRPLQPVLLLPPVLELVRRPIDLIVLDPAIIDHLRHIEWVTRKPIKPLSDVEAYKRVFMGDHSVHLQRHGRWVEGIEQHVQQDRLEWSIVLLLGG
ncbi:MAG: hypothetical protein AAFS10_25610, partial [Myxococcota bacterium]